MELKNLLSFTLLAAAIFLRIPCGAVAVKKLFDVTEMFKYTPVKCLPLTEQMMLNSIQKQDMCPVKKSVGKFVLTSNAESVCHNSCKKKSELLANRLNKVIRDGIVLAQKIYYDESDQESKSLINNREIKFVPHNLESKCSEKEQKYGCDCSYDLNLYGSKNAKTIIRKVVAELSKQKQKEIDEIFFNSEYLQHLYEKYNFRQKLILINHKPEGNNGNSKVQKKTAGGNGGNRTVKKKSVAAVAPIANSRHQLQRRSKKLKGIRRAAHGLILLGSIGITIMIFWKNLGISFLLTLPLVALLVGWSILIGMNINEGCATRDT